MSMVQSDEGVRLLEELAKSASGKSPLGCMQCGLCAATCPLGAAMEFPPRNLILQAAAGQLDKVLQSPALWMCVACYACSKRCPRGIELTEGVWPALRDAAMQAGIQPPAELQETFQNVFKYGNVLGKSPRQRLDWTKDLDVRVLDLSREPRPVDVLWLVGCYPSYYPRNQSVARAFARILTELGITWGILGTKERSPGECDRMFGEEGLFETLVEQNRQVLDKVDFGKLVVLDPHAFRALQSYYPRFGAWYPVAALYDVPRRAPGATATFDCQTGGSRRHLPRQLLRGTAIRMLRSAPGIAAIDPQSEAGGDATQPRQLALLRRRWRRDVAGLAYRGPGRTASFRRPACVRRPTPGAEILAVSCPYELSRFEDAAKVTGLEGQLKVRDIIELLAESMELGERSLS